MTVEVPEAVANVRLFVWEDMVPEFVKVPPLASVIVWVAGRVSVPVFEKVVIPDIVREELLPVEIVPALVRVVMLERVAVFGRVMVAPELLVRVVGERFAVAPDVNAIVPEFVMVPVIDMVEAALKFVVQLALLLNPVLVIDVRDGKFRVAALFVNVPTLEIV